MLLTVKSNQKSLYRQIGAQFQGKRHIPFTASDHEKRHGRDTLWELSAKEAPERIKTNWPGSAWIVEVITDTVKAGGQRTVRRHLDESRRRTSRCDTSIRTTPDGLLRLIRQRWSNCFSSRRLRLRRSLAAMKTSGTGPATPSSVRTPTATPIAPVHRCLHS